MNRSNRKGFTLVEAGCVTFIIAGVILLLIGIFWGVPSLFKIHNSKQAVPDFEAFEYVENLGHTNIQILETHRVNPAKSMGCAKGSNAGFRLSGVHPDDYTEQIELCAIGMKYNNPRFTRMDQ